MRKRILIAEDCVNLTDILSVLLEQVNCSIVWAKDGEECVDIAKAEFSKGQAFDLVIVDIRMPKLNGFEVAKHLRSEGFDGPIVAITAVPTPEGEEESKVSGLDAYLSKDVLKISWFEEILGVR